MARLGRADLQRAMEVARWAALGRNRVLTGGHNPRML